MLKFDDVQIVPTSLNINGRREMIFKIKIKNDDYTMEDFESLCSMIDDTQFALVLAPFQEKDTKEDILPGLRRQLVMACKEYCEKWWYNEETEKLAIYGRNNVASRGDMTEEQLRDEISLYRTGTQALSL